MKIRQLPPVMVAGIVAGRPQLRRAIDALRVARWATRERVMRWGVGFAVLSVIVMGGATVLNWTSDVALKYMATDFANYWAGARLAAGGHASVAYDLAGFDAFEKSLFGPILALLVAAVRRARVSPGERGVW